MFQNDGTLKSYMQGGLQAMLKNVGFILRAMGEALKCFQQGSALIMDFLIISPAFIRPRWQNLLLFSNIRFSFLS